MTKSETISVTLTQRFSVPAERVFDAWLDPALIARWMFGPAVREEEVLEIKIDARVGGRFSFRVRRSATEIDHVGSYLELERPKRLVFTWGIKGEGEDDISQVSVDIAPQGHGCLLTLTHEMDAKWAEYADRAREAWAKMVGVLARTIA